MSKKLRAGEKFPDLNLKGLDGRSLKLGVPLRENTEWLMIVVYRGKHCPICTKYLKSLNSKQNDFYNAGVDVLAISCDPEQKVRDHIDEMGIELNIGYDLSLEQARTLGLYISEPRSPKETDRPFTEPGILVVNEESKLHVVDLANNPFVRPDLDLLLDGLKFIKNPENNYPIRGTME